MELNEHIKWSIFLFLFGILVLSRQLLVLKKIGYKNLTKYEKYAWGRYFYMSLTAFFASALIYFVR